VNPGADPVPSHDELFVEVQRLRAQAELNRRILEALPGGVIEVALGGAFIHANAEAQRFLGLSWDELSRRFVSDFDTETFWEDGSRCREPDYPVTKCLQTGQPQPPTTIGVRRPDGQIAWGVFTAIPLLGEDGRSVSGAVVTFLDISASKRAEEALREAEARFRAFMDNSPCLALLKDDQGRILYVNKLYQSHFRKTSEELLGKSAFELHAPDVARQLHENDTRVLTTNQALEAVESVPTPDGMLRHWLMMKFPVDDASGRRFIGGVALEITERRRAEDQLQEYAQQLQALSRRLLEVQEQERRHIARELHEEVGQVLTALTLNLDTGARVPAATLRERLAVAQGLVKDLTARVRDLSLELRPAMLDDLGLLPALLWQFKRYRAQTRIQVDFEHAGLDRRFASELETAIYRIVQEALTNVARHAGVDGVSVRVQLEHDRLSLQVEDRGRGFDAALARSAGRSSGLSGMRERAVLLRGKLDVTTAPGHGTRVTAELPVRISDGENDGRDSHGGR
jgi:PAS domain S-box-containing protein